MRSFPFFNNVIHTVTKNKKKNKKQNLLLLVTFSSQCVKDLL